MRALSRIGRIFKRNEQVDVAETRVHFDEPPTAVWQRMLFYEEVPRRPMWLLRWFLPAPIRTRGEKTRVGAVIECEYENGFLEKCITAVEPARSVSFDVRVQKLGIEDCISMDGGSYELLPSDNGGSDVVLMTRYHGHLRPRWLWLRVERLLAHRLHRHILDGMRTP